MTDESLEMQKLRAELTEARDWVRRMHNEAQVLTCAYCGHAYPPGTPPSSEEALSKHIESCPKHPMAKLRVELDEAIVCLAYLTEQFGPWHEDDCPGDDTCDCEPGVLLNLALGRTERVEAARARMKARAGL